MNITETTLDFHQQLSATKDLGQLWQGLHQILAEYGITSLMYGFAHTTGISNLTDYYQSMTIICSHPEDFMEYMTCQCSWEDDISLRHVISEETVLPWYGPLYKRKITNKRQQKIEDDASSLNMGIGINLPFRFSQERGKGGFGLAAGEHDARSFDKIWLERGHEIIQLTALFDTLVRERNPNTMLRLTPREKECLKWLSTGLRPQQIADRLGNAYRTVEKQIASARHKLNARSNEQAVAKSLIYGVLDL